MISAALAVPPFTSTTIGMPGQLCGFASRYTRELFGARPRVATTSCPGSRNSSLTAIPWSSRPPGLPRRSRMSDFIPFFPSSLIAVVSSSAEVSLTGDRAMNPTRSSSIIDVYTERMWIVARTTLKVSGWSTPTRLTRSSTLVPGAPRSSFTAWSFFQPSVERPSNAVI